MRMLAVIKILGRWSKAQLITPETYGRSFQPEVSKMAFENSLLETNVNRVISGLDNFDDLRLASCTRFDPREAGIDDVSEDENKGKLFVL